jgi:hypothetical protein
METSNDGIVLRQMSLAEFAAASPMASPQLTAMRAMQPGTAIVLSHDGLAHAAPKCSLHRMAALMTKAHPTLRFATRHLPDGSVAVACRYEVKR